MPKKLSDAEITELKSLGSVKMDPKVHNVARFDELINKLTQLVDSQSQRTQADLARSQSQLEVLATLQKMIRQQNGTKSHVSHETIDLTPLQEVLSQIQAVNAERAEMAYSFEIQRGPNGGPMQRVIARPMTTN